VDFGEGIIAVDSSDDGESLANGDQLGCDRERLSFRIMPSSTTLTTAPGQTTISMASVCVHLFLKWQASR
jgi:hypothetical protein